MARTKNREYQQVLSPAYTFSRRWKMGGYIRLSKEDLKKALNGKDDSNSVKNQRALLNDFYRKYQEEFESITEYVDDGHTGTDSGPGGVPTTSGRRNEPQDRLCCGKRPFPLCPQLQRRG